MSATRLVTMVAIMTGSIHMIMAQQLPLAFEAGGGVSFRGATGSMSPIAGIPLPNNLTYISEGLRLHGIGSLSVDVKLLSWMSVGTRITGGTSSGVFVAPERVPIVRADTVFRATLEHRFEASVTCVSLEPFVRLWPWSFLAVDVGIPVSVQLGSTFKQTQRFTDPVGLQFTDGTVTQQTASGTVPDVRAVVPLASTRLNGLLPLSQNAAWHLVPYVGASAALASQHSTSSWNEVRFDIGIGVRYQPQDAPPQLLPRIDTIYVRDTITVLQPGMTDPTVALDERIVSDVIEVDPSVSSVTIYERYRRFLPKPPAVLDASVRVMFVVEGGEEASDATIKTRRRRYVTSVPLMPVVVFDGGSSELPARYVKFTKASAVGFAERELLGRPGEHAEQHWYQHTLNVVGSRMKRMPRNVLVLRTGGNASIGAARAESVRAYITHTYNVDSRRVRHEHTADADSAIVHLVDQSCDLLGPVVRIDTVTESQLPSVRIYPDVVSDAGLASWVLDVVQQDSVVYSIKGTGDVPTSVSWDMNSDIDAKRALRAPLEIAITVLDREGSKMTSEPASVMLREAAIIDASAGLATFGQWLMQGTSASPLRPCAAAPPPDARLVEERDFDTEGRLWWNTGVPSAEGYYWRGTWRLLNKE